MTQQTETETKTEARQESVQARRCLLCGDDFLSEGRHNRICKRCKNTQVWRQG